MVVRFTSPTGPSVGGGEEEKRERIAPVTYLPGAKPGVRATEALNAVERARRAADDHPSTRAQRPDADVKRTGARAAHVSLHQLARRGMSRWELQEVLRRREVDPETADAELNRLESVGLLDDAALAVTLVFTQHTRKGLGRRAIENELRRRHIDQELIDDALAEIADDDELERALELAHKRVGQLHGVDDETARRRLNGYLARKGYSSELVRKAVESALGTREHTVRFR